MFSGFDVFPGDLIVFSGMESNCSKPSWNSLRLFQVPFLIHCLFLSLSKNDTDEGDYEVGFHLSQLRNATSSRRELCVKNRRLAYMMKLVGQFL